MHGTWLAGILTIVANMILALHNACFAEFPTNTTYGKTFEKKNFHGSLPYCECFMTNT